MQLHAHAESVVDFLVGGYFAIFKNQVAQGETYLDYESDLFHYLEQFVRYLLARIKLGADRKETGPIIRKVATQISILQFKQKAIENIRMFRVGEFLRGHKRGAQVKPSSQSLEYEFGIIVR